MVKQTVTYQHLKIEYFLKRTNQNHFQIKYQPPHVIVTAAHKISLLEIESFIISQIPQIQKWRTIKTRMLVSAMMPPYFAFFLNKKYPMQINEGSLKNNVILNCNTIIVNQRSVSKVATGLIFQQFLKTQAKNFLTTRVIMWSQKMQLQYFELKFQVLRSKWGSCQFQRKKIVLNARIIHFDYAIIDYIIVHEIAHLQHPNHSKVFWELVATHYPDFKTAQKFLRQIFI